MPAVGQKEIDQLNREKALAQEVADMGVKSDSVSFNGMMGIGSMVKIGDREYEVAPVPLVRMAEVSALFKLCPDMLVTHALVAAKNGGFDVAKTASYLEGIRGDGNEVSVPSIEAAVVFSSFNLSQEEVEAMVSLVVIVLERRFDPDKRTLLRPTIENDCDITAFMNVMAALFALDPHLAQRFLTRTATAT